MTAIGINVSDRDPIYDWEEITPKKHSPEMVAYIEARDEAVRLWHRYTMFVDSWLAVGNLDAMHEAEDEAKAADERAHRAYLATQCEHKHEMVFGTPENWVSVCADCGFKS